MQRSKHYKLFLAGWLLLAILAMSLPGGLALTARAAPQAQASMQIVINEVAWAGTQASSDDDWVELYNPSPAEVDISDWELISNSFSITFPTPTILMPGSYYLIERRQAATDVAANLVSARLLFGNDGDTLRLRDALGTLVDSANLAGGPWPAGDPVTTATMERDPALPDSDAAWLTYTGAGGPALDAAGNPERNRDPDPLAHAHPHHDPHAHTHV